MADASYPEDLRYHPEHDWARVDGDTATLGITWYAEVESVKAVSDVIAPVSGEIVEVNETLKDAPEKINDDAYGEGWLVKVKLSEPSELDELLDAENYRSSLS